MRSCVTMLSGFSLLGAVLSAAGTPPPARAALVEWCGVCGWENAGGVEQIAPGQ